MKTLLIIDRFEDNWAVIEYGRNTFNFPRKLVPNDAKEGDVLSFNVCINKKETLKRNKYIKDLADNLFKESGN